MVRGYLKQWPSDPVGHYSRSAAKQMLEMEKEPYELADLNYQVNSISQKTYHRVESPLLEGLGLQLLHEFLCESNRFAEAILRQRTRKLEYLLRLYFMNELYPDGDAIRGALSFKSHWSGFAAGFPCRMVIERIRATFEAQKEWIMSVLEEVHKDYVHGIALADPITTKWLSLLARYDRKATTLLRSGVRFANTMTFDQVRSYRDFLKTNGHERNEFMDLLLEDERFVPAFDHDEGLARRRVLTNLLYMIIPAIGLTVIHKMAGCYFAYRAVEAYYKRDLTDVLRDTIWNVLQSPTGSHLSGQ
jgi:hypothetical protein